MVWIRAAASRVQKAIEAAQKSDAIIYSIYYTPYAGFAAAIEGTLKRMSEETGGRVFDVGRRLNLDEIFKQIQDEMRSAVFGVLTRPPIRSKTAAIASWS